ncbi:hypothetical protein HPT27_18420 [Permianibacter sp. IMCC34836]|uniref:hypothetical protein n=1 Tax=Permianibacter fluminis TaxID=2738515 RepID=UPI0015537856|nr:hypothetical protein [Permianibacter fluminis]NQD38995.1 hypothetical protein [Permianibacter fluminis]
MNIRKLHFQWVLPSIVVLSTSALSQDEVFIVPSGSPFSQTVSENPDITRFYGTTELSGSFEFAWDIRDSEPLYLELKFYPNEQSQKKLPYMVGTAPPTELVVFDADIALPKLLSPELTQEIRGKSLLQKRGEATIRVKNLFTAVDCDHRAYVVTFDGVIE